MIDKWLKAGVLEESLLRHATDDTIRDSLVKKVSELGMWDRIEVFYDVNIDRGAGGGV
jgi:hypothetical protein